MIRILSIAALATCLLLAVPARRAAAAERIPVIYDTDIGDDIDDTWALGLLVKSPELDVKLVLPDYRDTIYRAKVAAKFLTVVGRSDIPVGLGVHKGERPGNQGAWVQDYDLKSYAGTIHEDGVGAMIDIIMNSPTRVTVICVCPMPNIAAALEREPRIVEKARFVGMHGSVRKGYNNSPTISAEWNVRGDVAACRKALGAAWDVTITPVDTCGLVHLRGDKYTTVRDSNDPVARAIIENYRIWSGRKPERAQTASSTLFDTVAVYLAISEDLLKMERLGIRINDDGTMAVDPSLKQLNVATEWKDMGAFEDLLVKRLTTPISQIAPLR